MTMVELLALPLLACLVLAGIHVYLGLHVLARGVIFVDLALAQVAALGITAAFLAGHSIQSTAAYWYALVFTVGGAALFALARPRRWPVPQEAIIGIVYAVAAASAVLVVDRAPQGGEAIKQLLVGSVLTVSTGDVLTLAASYAAIGVLHWCVRRPLLEISFEPEAAFARGRRVRAWDFLFYLTFGLVVTSSVRIAGVLLVFSFLIVPATAAALLARSVLTRLILGWALGAVVSVAGLAASWIFDLPTGATIVATSGVVLALIAASLAARRLTRELGRRGVIALRGIAVVLAFAITVAGAQLIALPAMDHLWLNALEQAWPPVELAFLTPFERETWQESYDAIGRAARELERLKALQTDVQWGRRTMDEAMTERRRQFLLSRGEIAAGDRMVLKVLRAKAREHQRYTLGVPLTIAGALAATMLLAGRHVGRVMRRVRAARGSGPTRRSAESRS